MALFESEDGSMMSIPEDVEQSLGVGNDLFKAGQNSGLERSEGNTGQSLGKASSCDQEQTSSWDDCLIREHKRMESFSNPQSRQFPTMCTDSRPIASVPQQRKG